MAKQKRSITAEDLLHLNVVNDPQFSPDGSKFVYTSRTVTEKHAYQSHLFMQDIADEKTIKLTNGTAMNSQPRFSPDGSKLAFLSNRSGRNQIWVLPLTGGEAYQLTHFKHGASELFWSPDGNYLLFSARLQASDDVNAQQEPTAEQIQAEEEKKSKQGFVVNRLKYKSDAAGFLDDTWKQLVLYDIENNSFQQLTTEAADHSPGGWSPDSHYIGFTANIGPQADQTQTQDIYTFETRSKTINKLTDSNGFYYGIQFSPSSEKIACLGHQFEYAGATLSKLWTIDLHSKEKKNLVEQWDVQLGDSMIGDTASSSIYGPEWASDGSSIYVAASEYGKTGLFEIDMDGKKQSIYDQDNHVYAFAYDKASEAIIVGISDPLNPGDFYLLSKSEAKRLTSVNARLLEEVVLATPQSVKAKAADGLDIHGWLMKPAQFEEGEKYPLVLEIHGGPHAMYGLTFFHELQLLAAQGYAVLFTNPRGSHGYGQAFVNGCRSDYGGKDYTDIMSSLDAVLEKNDWIDQSKLAVTGGSYGGFMTNWIVSHNNRFKAAVTQRSISNWLSFYGVSDIGFYFTKWEIGHDLLDNPEKLWDHSPLKYAKNVDTPLLILHGENDFRCPIEQAEQLFITLKHLRKDVEFVRFPGANHELSRSGDPLLRIDRLQRIVGWFKKYI
ncbi:S9 family peptidase [Radiobacillus sp. PE A8.2]|uniref:S9 family peptidase n=1 Tax=Radiobacillus sp. PE A8.2 TaxID=3380349 RepID=UPI00388E0F45